MGWDGLLPEILSEINSNSWVPVKGAIIHGILCAMISLIFTLDELVNIVSVAFLVTFASINCCCLSLWYRDQSNYELK